MSSSKRADSYNLMIFKSFSLVFVFVLAAKAVGAFKEIAIAGRYGTSPVVDAYALGFSISNWPITVASMSSSTMLIPLFVKAGYESEQSDRMFRSMLAWTLLIAIFLSGATAFLISEQAANAMRLGRPEMAAALNNFAIPLALMVPPGILATLFAAKLMAGRNYISSLFEAVPSAVLIVAIFAGSGKVSGAYLIGLATLIGFGAYLAALIMAQPGPWGRMMPSFNGSRLLFESVGRDTLIIISAQITMSLAGVVLDQFVATNLGGQANAVLGYSNRLIMLITSLGATAVGRATLPVFAAAQQAGKQQERSLALRWAALTLALGFIGTITAYLSARPTVALLFHHGHFNNDDLASVTQILRYGVWQFPFYFSSLILSQAIASQHRYKDLLAANIAAALIKLSLVFVLARWIGLPGVMLSTAAMYATSFFVLGVMVWKPHIAD